MPAAKGDDPVTAQMGAMPAIRETGPTQAGRRGLPNERSDATAVGKLSVAGGKVRAKVEALSRMSVNSIMNLDQFLRARKTIPLF